LVVVAAGVLVVAWGYWLRSDATVKLGGQDVAVELLPECRDFGEVWETQSFPWQLRFRNPTGQSIRIELLSRCDCAGFPPQPSEIPPGGTASIPLSLDLRRLGYFDDQPVRNVRFEVGSSVWVSGEDPRKYSWTVSGRVRRHLNYPRSLGLSEDLVCDIPGALREVPIHAVIPLSGLRLKRFPKGWMGEVRQTETPNRYLLRLIPLMTSPGVFQDTVELEAKDEQGILLPTQELHVQGVVKERIELFPREIVGGAQEVGTRMRSSLSITSRFGEEVVVQGVEAADGKLSLAQSRQGGHTTYLDIDWVAEGLGDQVLDGTVIAQVAADRARVYRVPFRIRWYGVPKGNKSDRP
jgi:hypothetical protein